MVCVHYATGLQAKHVTDDGDHPLLGWIGGYFATGCKHHRSVARVCPATLVPETADHPVLRGWTAKLPIPPQGVKSSLPDLATFKPVSVEPQPSRKGRPEAVQKKTGKP